MRNMKSEGPRSNLYERNKQIIQTQVKWIKKVTWREEKTRNITQINESACKSVSTLPCYIKNLSTCNYVQVRSEFFHKVTDLSHSHVNQFSDLPKVLAYSRRSMNLRTYIRNNNRYAIPFVTKPIWNPPIHESMPLKNYFNKTKYELKILQTQRIKSHLSQRETLALRSLYKQSKHCYKTSG
jgi:hypothetical protein